MQLLDRVLENIANYYCVNKGQAWHDSCNMHNHNEPVVLGSEERERNSLMYDLRRSLFSLCGTISEFIAGDNIRVR